MKLIGAFVLATLTLTNVAPAQRVVHHSNHILAINGSWDATKDPQHAQFVSGNQNIQALFINNYELARSRLNRVRKGFVELEFVVKADGRLDSIQFLQRDETLNDHEAIRLLMLTDGAWRPATRNGERQSEKLIIRYYFYDNAKSRGPEKKWEKAKEAFEKGNFKSTAELCDEALDINPFETEILKLKAWSLLNLNEKNEACETVALAKRYFASGLEELLVQACGE